MANDSISRVNYFDRQFLRTQDFTDEQAYQIGMRRRHNISQHQWGIVEGLQIVLEEGNLFVQPGVAIDIFGRELILENRTQISSGVFTDKGSEVIQVWLAYGTLSSDNAPQGYAGCGNGGASLFYRLQEIPQIELLPPDPVYPDPRNPKGVSAGDAAFDPTRTPPDDPQRYWPVFLGLLTRDLKKTPPVVIDPTGRPYVGLIGESVSAPSGRTTLQIGSELVNNDPNRFAVFIPEAGNAPALAIDKDGRTTIQGNATIAGDLKMVKGAIEFGAGTATGPQPWRVYHNVQMSSHAAADNSEMESLRLDQELRIEMAGDSSTGSNQVVIGLWSAKDSKFVPCLTVDDQCNVTVHGNLIVQGQVTTPGTVVPGAFSPEAQAYVTSSLLTGLGAGNLSLQRTTTRAFTSSLAAAAPAGEALSALHAQHPDLASAVGTLHNPDRLDAFATFVKRSGGNLLKDLKSALGEG